MSRRGSTTSATPASLSPTMYDPCASPSSKICLKNMRPLPSADDGADKHAAGDRVSGIDEPQLGRSSFLQSAREHRACDHADPGEQPEADTAPRRPLGALDEME